MYPLLYVHAVLMCIAFLLLLCGFLVARFLKRKSYWLKIHRPFGITGTAIAVLGAIAISLQVYLTGGEHLSVPHSYLGIVIVFLTIVIPVIGFLQFRLRGKAATLRIIHIWSGRIALVLMLLNILAGLKLAGLI